MLPRIFITILAFFFLLSFRSVDIFGAAAVMRALKLPVTKTKLLTSEVSARRHWGNHLVEGHLQQIPSTVTSCINPDGFQASNSFRISDYKQARKDAVAQCQVVSDFVFICLSEIQPTKIPSLQSLNYSCGEAFVGGTRDNS